MLLKDAKRLPETRNLLHANIALMLLNDATIGCCYYVTDQSSQGNLI